MRLVPRARHAAVTPLLLALVVLTAGCTAPASEERDDGDGDDGATGTGGVTQWFVDTRFPVDVEPLPDGRFLVASLDGRVILLADGGETVGTPITIDVHPPMGEVGLLGMTLHPDYPDAPWVYVFFTEPSPREQPVRDQTIARFRLTPGDETAGPLEPVVTGIPASAVCCHNGGRLAFGPDGMLYATLGDNQMQATAQDPEHPAGSILRYTPEGGIPEDNPHPASPVVVTGVRNAFGLTFDDEWGIVITDNGPSRVDGPPGYDEVHVLGIGDNAGWPLAWGDINHDGMVAPVWHSGSEATSPTGVIVPRGSAVPEWDGKVLFCNFNTNAALLVDPAEEDPEADVVSEGCTFDVAQDAKGRILMTSTNAIRVIS